MAGSRALKNRIRSTKNIRQTTRAMEAVSAVKMRKSQAAALSARPYALTALSILKEAQRGAIDGAVVTPLSEVRRVDKILLVVITSDKGLAGSFNASVIKKAEKIIANSGKGISIVAVGKKGRDYFARRNIPVAAEFLGTGDFGAINQTRHISDTLADLFSTKLCDEVIIVYTNFLSALKQEVIVRKLLPFTPETLTEIVESIKPMRGKLANMPAALEESKVLAGELLFEPSPQAVLSKLLPELLAVEVFHAILEANASEHSSRMIAMKNASDNAAELVDELNILYNKTRQAGITKELTEITAGKEALQV